MRLIDATRLRFEANRFFRNDIKVQDEVDFIICMMPTIDAVPVVRCKDCRWYAPNNDGSWFGCSFNTELPEDEPKEDDFCSYGERKDDAED